MAKTEIKPIGIMISPEDYEAYRNDFMAIESGEQKTEKFRRQYYEKREADILERCAEAIKEMYMCMDTEVKRPSESYFAQERLRISLERLGISVNIISNERGEVEVKVQLK